MSKHTLNISSMSRFQTKYGPNPTFPGIDCSNDVILTVQADAQSCDINYILEQYVRTGSLPVSSSQPVFGDFTDGNDYQEKLNLVIDAQEAFMALDARVRARFENDPAQLIHFLSDSSNRPEAVRLGLVQDLDTQGAKIAPSASADNSKPVDQDLSDHSST